MVKNLIFILFLALSVNTFGQTATDSQAEEYMRLTLSSKKDLGNNNILSIHYGFNADTVSQVIVKPVDNEEYLNREFLKGGMKQRFKYFDFGFEGDRLVFQKEFSHVEIPSAPRLEWLGEHSKLIGHHKHRLLSISLFRDSTVFFFTTDSLLKPMFWGEPARFNGNLGLLETKISKLMEDVHVETDIDSIVVFRAIVIAGETRNQDKLQLDELIYGEETAFSNMVRQVLSDTNNTSSTPSHSNWVAATNVSARPQTTRIKIFALLKPDGLVKLELPSKLQNWTGD